MAFEYELKDVKSGSNLSQSTDSTPDSVASISPEIKEWMSRSLLPRTLLEGTYGMRMAGNAFLPTHSLESTTAYSNRLARSTLLNAFKKTASFLAGQVFQSDVIFDDSVDKSFIDWSLKIDSKGNDLDVIMKRIFQNGISKGVSHILIDVPQASEDIITKADETLAGIRPYIKEIRPEDVLGYIVDDSGFLIQVRIAESKKVRVGRFGIKTVKMIRVLEPGTWELHEVDNYSSNTLIESGTFSIPIIPFVTFIPGDEWSILTGETPLMDLADLNAKHWRSMSDQDNILSVARVPILFGRNIELANMPVGVATMITSEDDDSDIKYVEVQGKAIESGREDIKETEAQMALYGLQQLIPRTGNMTATEKAISSAESNSSLGTWATEFESVLNETFKIMGMFMGIDFPDEGVSINKEYAFGIADPQELAQILKSNEQGILSAQACFSEFRRRGIFEEHLSWSDMEADLEKEKQDAIDMSSLAGSSFGGEGDNE